jgi:hypothetical protein
MIQGRMLESPYQFFEESWLQRVFAFVLSPSHAGKRIKAKQMVWVIWNVSDQEQTTLEQRRERRQREAGRRKPFGPPLGERWN